MTEKTDYWVIPTDLAVALLDDTDIEQLERIAKKIAKSTQHDYEGAVVITTDDPRFDDVSEYIERHGELAVGPGTEDEFNLSQLNEIQPMGLESSNVSICFNGKVENVHVSQTQIGED